MVQPKLLLVVVLQATKDLDFRSLIHLPTYAKYTQHAGNTNTYRDVEVELQWLSSFLSRHLKALRSPSRLDAEGTILDAED